MEMLTVLIDKGFDVNYDLGVALKIATYYEIIDVVKLLVNAGANVGIDNESCLCTAIDIGCSELVELLLKNGADISHITCENIENLIRSDSSTIETLQIMEKYGFDFKCLSNVRKNKRVEPLIDFFLKFDTNAEKLGYLIYNSLTTKKILD